MILTNLMPDMERGMFQFEGEGDVDYNALVQQKEATKGKFFIPCTDLPVTYFDTYRQGPVYSGHLGIIHLLTKAYQDFQICGNDVASHIDNFVPFMRAIYPNITSEIVFPFVSLLKDYPDLDNALKALEKEQVVYDSELNKVYEKVLKGLLSL